jgi:GTP-binding protein LepA
MPRWSIKPILRLRWALVSLRLLGLLHMDIIQERLEREFNLSLIATAPSVVYRITRTNNVVEEIDNPRGCLSGELLKVEEPMVTTTILVPQEYVVRCSNFATTSAASRNQWTW